MGARTYGPQIERFLTQDRYESASADQRLQSDPLRQARYVFAGGNPVYNVEFDGHYATTGGDTRTSTRMQVRGGRVMRNRTHSRSTATQVRPRVCAW